jgi:hypothetical protein
MFAGHIGAGLVIGRADRRINVGVFIIAALLLDVALWLFVLLGWESVAIPADFAASHQAAFVFPYSHGLVAGLIWSAVAAGIGLVLYRRLEGPRLRVALPIAAAVFSHWILDALVHAAELPIAGYGSARVGLGLWDRMPLALTVEAAVVVAGLWLYVPGAPLSRTRKIALTMLSLVVLAFTVIGMTMAPAPPSAFAMAASSLAALILVCGLALWLGRLSGPRHS